MLGAIGAHEDLGQGQLRKFHKSHQAFEGKEGMGVYFRHALVHDEVALGVVVIPVLDEVYGWDLREEVNVELMVAHIDH